MIFPGETDWELWNLDDTSQNSKNTANKNPVLHKSTIQEILSDYKNRESLGIAIPVMHAFTAAIELPESSKSEALHAAALEAERLGIFEGRSADESVWDWRMAPHDSTGGRADRTDSDAGAIRQVTIAALPRKIPDELVVADASQFIPSFDCLDISADGLIIWKELGKLVIAAAKKRQIAHAQPLTDDTLTPTVIHEIRCLQFQMEVAGIIESQSAISLIGDFSDDDLLQVERQLALRATRVPRLVPRMTARPLSLTPLEVIAAREQKKRNRIRLRIMLAVALVYIAAMAGWLSWLYHLDELVKISAKELELSTPRAIEAMEFVRRWDTVKAVTDTRRDPVAVLKAVVEAMPGEGLRMTTYLQKGNDILIEGECRSSLVALDFSKNLKNSAQTAGIEWMPEIPQPQKNSMMYRFVIKGRMGYAPPE